MNLQLKMYDISQRIQDNRFDIKLNHENYPQYKMQNFKEIEFLALNMKYAYVKSSAKSIDVLDAKTLNKISTL